MVKNGNFLKNYHFRVIFDGEIENEHKIYENIGSRELYVKCAQKG